MTPREELAALRRLAELEAKASGGAASAAPAAPARPEVPNARQATMNQLGGFLRGAASIGASLITPPTQYNRDGSVDPRGFSERRAARLQDVEGGLRSLGADPDALGFQIPKVAAEVAGTLGVGPAIAAGLTRAAPALAARAAPLLDAIRTAGFSAGGVSGKAGLALRSAGGGITGGVAAGAVNPEDADMGAGLGAALPGTLQLLGKGSQAVGRAFRGSDARAGERLANILETDPATVAAQLRRAQELVPGSQPTVAQVLRTPQASIAENVVSMSPGGAALKQRTLDQNAARMAALESVAPTNPLGAGSARAEFGEALGSLARNTDRSMRAETSRRFAEVPKDEAMLYLPDLAAIRDDLFPANAIVNREAVDKVVQAAQDIGLSRAPGVPRSYVPKRAEKLSEAIRKAGGLNLSQNSGLAGELQGIRGDFKGLVRNQSGLSPARMAEKLHEAGYLPDDQASTLVNALRDEAGGASVVSVRDEAFRLPGGGTGPAAQPRKVTLGQLETLRQDIGELARNAPPQSREKLALDRMRAALDDRIDEVVRGDGLPDENLPIDWANKLTAARQAKVDQVQTTGTGPQSFALRRGQDGMPMYQSQELAQKAWRQNAPPEDIQQLRKLIDKNPRVLQQFRSMVTTEGAGTADAGGALTSKFVRWTENALPGLRKVFNEGEVKTLQRIAQDIKRAEAAAAAGKTRNSSTYQNAANALSLGMLDSPVLNAAANRVPVVNSFTGPGLQWMREGAREKQARALARLFTDPAEAARVLDAAAVKPDSEFAKMLANPQFRASVLRTAPVLQADR